MVIHLLKMYACLGKIKNVNNSILSWWYNNKFLYFIINMPLVLNQKKVPELFLLRIDGKF